MRRDGCAIGRVDRAKAANLLFFLTSYHTELYSTRTVSISSKTKSTVQYFWWTEKNVAGLSLRLGMESWLINHIRAASHYYIVSLRYSLPFTHHAFIHNISSVFISQSTMRRDATYRSDGGNVTLGAIVLSLFPSSLRYSSRVASASAPSSTCSRPHSPRSRLLSSGRWRRCSRRRRVRPALPRRLRRIRYLQSPGRKRGKACRALWLRSSSTRLVRPLQQCRIGF